ncbi:hypothetical protein [Niallia taxi]|uniref:hypothetical protein n=1 Tax=Niallia taxi TaxID=2499688 RepID=UPI0015F760F4|nr:hypothetical protein [Niallia taxi]
MTNLIPWNKNYKVTIYECLSRNKKRINRTYEVRELEQRFRNSLDALDYLETTIGSGETFGRGIIKKFEPYNRTDPSVENSFRLIKSTKRFFIVGDWEQNEGKFPYKAQIVTIEYIGKRKRLNPIKRFIRFVGIKNKKVELQEVREAMVRLGYAPKR